MMRVFTKCFTLAWVFAAGAGAMSISCAGSESGPLPVRAADCRVFEATVKQLPGPNWTGSQETIAHSDARLLDLGRYWCVEASPTYRPKSPFQERRDYADRLLQQRLFKMLLVSEGIARVPPPITDEHRDAVAAYTSAAESILCPDWRTTPYETPSSMINKQAVRIQCR
jgi:hypothetical protein